MNVNKVPYIHFYLQQQQVATKKKRLIIVGFAAFCRFPALLDA